LFQLLQHGRLLLLNLLPASPGFAHPLIRSQVSLEFPQPFVDRGSTQTAGRCNLRDPAPAEQLRIRGGDQAPLTLVQVRAQLAVFLLQRGLRSHTFSLKCFGENVQLILPRLLSAQAPDVATPPAKATRKTIQALKPAQAQSSAKAASREGVREGSKTAQVVALLQRDHGATLPEIMQKMGWLKHTVRGFMAGAMKKAGYTVESFKPEGGQRTYRINADAK
jgi:hypothetical protein